MIDAQCQSDAYIGDDKGEREDEEVFFQERKIGGDFVHAPFHHQPEVEGDGEVDDKHLDAAPADVPPLDDHMAAVDEIEDRARDEEHEHNDDRDDGEVERKPVGPHIEVGVELEGLVEEHKSGKEGGKDANIEELRSYLSEDAREVIVL